MRKKTKLAISVDEKPAKRKSRGAGLGTTAFTNRYLIFSDALLALKKHLPQLANAMDYNAFALNRLDMDKGNLIFAKSALKVDPSCGWALEMEATAKQRDVQGMKATIAKNQAIIDEVRMSIDVVVRYPKAHAIEYSALLAVCMGIDSADTVLIQHNLDGAIIAVYGIEALAAATPEDLSAYRPAKDFLDDAFPDYKAINKALKEHGIDWRRPLGKNGLCKNRRVIHAGQ